MCPVSRCESGIILQSPHRCFKFVRYSAAELASGFLWNQSVEVQADGGAEVGEAAVTDCAGAVDEGIGDSPVKGLAFKW